MPWCWRQSRRQRDALATIDRAIALDPLDPIAPELKSWMLLFGRQLTSAAAGAARRALQLEPGRLRATAFLGVALFMLGVSSTRGGNFKHCPPTTTVVSLRGSHRGARNSYAQGNSGHRGTLS